MESLTSAQGTNGTLQTIRCPCEKIILSIGHFERLLASDQEAVRGCRLILLKRQWTFFNASFQNLFI